jgi:bacterioferritin-associated ferredoxin
MPRSSQPSKRCPKAESPRAFSRFLLFDAFRPCSHRRGKEAPSPLGGAFLCLARPQPPTGRCGVPWLQLPWLWQRYLSPVPADVLQPERPYWAPFAFALAGATSLMKAPGNFCRGFSTGSFHWLCGSHSRTRMQQARRPRRAHRLGCCVQCGRCARTIRRILNEALAAGDSACRQTNGGAC